MEFNGLFSSPNITTVVKSRKMRDRTCDTYGRRDCVQGFGGEIGRKDSTPWMTCA